MRRLLFLMMGPFFAPKAVPNIERFTLFSNVFAGEIIAGVDSKDHKYFRIKNFDGKGFYLPRRIRRIALFRSLFYACYSLVVGVCFHYFKKRYDVIVAYDPFITGPVGLLISRITGARLVIEVNGNYGAEVNWELDRCKNGMMTRLKFRYVNAVIPFVINRSDGVILLYDDQLKAFQKYLKMPKIVSRFNYFVPVRLFKEGVKKGKYVLFVGHPWYRKGVDVLIESFNKISSDFPDYSLKIIGYFQPADKSYLQGLINGNDRIQICDPIVYDEIIRVMSECSVLVLPSRSEAMGRVILEAMACKKPVIGSNVDGIPTYITDGYNGLLVEPGNADDLSKKMGMVLREVAYAKRLGENGYHYVNETCSERRYLEHYTKVIDDILSQDKAVTQSPNYMEE